jgi:hypothetical protein
MHFPKNLLNLHEKNDVTGGGLEIIATAIIISNLRKVNELITSYSDKDENLGKIKFR